MVMKLILSIYYHCVVMHMKFCQDILLGNRGVIALWFQNVNEFFCPQSLISKQHKEFHETYTE